MDYLQYEGQKYPKELITRMLKIQKRPLSNPPGSRPAVTHQIPESENL